jgi:hypothetical protein
VKILIIWIFLVCCFLAGSCLIVFGFVKRRGEERIFNVKDLFRGIPMEAKTSTQLFIEGAFGIVIGLLALFFLDF